MSDLRRTSYLDGLLGAARACTGTTSALPPANWEWVGQRHRDGKCRCAAVQPLDAGDGR